MKVIRNGLLLVAVLALCLLSFEALTRVFLDDGMLYELEKLQIGMVAPDFETVDQDGVAWKLSDYRGKVVIVDFWGFW